MVNLPLVEDRINNSTSVKGGRVDLQGHSKHFQHTSLFSEHAVHIADGVSLAKRHHVIRISMGKEHRHLAVFHQISFVNSTPQGHHAVCMSAYTRFSVFTQFA